MQKLKKKKTLNEHTIRMEQGNIEDKLNQTKNLNKTILSKSLNLSAHLQLRYNMISIKFLGIINEGNAQTIFTGLHIPFFCLFSRFLVLPYGSSRD